MPTLSKVTGYIEVRRHRGKGYRWVMWLLAAQIEEVEMISERIYRRKQDAKRAAGVWAKRLRIETTGDQGS